MDPTRISLLSEAADLAEQVCQAQQVTPRVIVVVQGGVVQTVVSDGEINCDVLDYDNWKACGDPLEEQARCYAELAAEIVRGEAAGTFDRYW